jgi:DNA-binding NtrC family response regulator
VRLTPPRAGGARHRRPRSGAHRIWLPSRPDNPYHLPDRMWDTANRRTLTRLQSAERTGILAALRQSDGNRSKAASLLGIGRTTLYRELHGLGIDDAALLA